MKPVVKRWAEALFREAQDESAEELPKLAENFYAALRRANKFAWAKSIIEALQKISAQKSRAETVRVRAARDLSKNIVENIAQIFETSPQQITVAIDPGLLGGVVIEQKDFVYDLSIKKQIDLLRESLIS